MTSTPPSTDLPPWHTALTTQIFQAASIQTLIERAPNAEVLADVWKLVLIELHCGRLTPNTGTLRRWKEAVGARTIELMREDPSQASFVYSTLFTFFDGEARDALFVELNNIVK